MREEIPHCLCGMTSNSVLASKLSLTRTREHSSRKLLKAVSKNLDVDLSDTTITRVNSVETIDAALNSGQYSRVVYYGHVLNGELTPNLNWAGMDADLFKFLMPGSVSELNVYGCQSAQFTTQLYDSSGGLKVGGMQGDLFERVSTTESSRACTLAPGIIRRK